jgi:diketogulonate reductase-like aldo/keto reductase
MSADMPRILYGTAWKGADTARLVALALRQGFRGLDTACQPKHYDEAAVGAGLAACLGPALSRSNVYLQSKFTQVPGHDPRRIPYDPKAPLALQVKQSFAVSLQNLQTDYLDCLVLHSPLPTAQQTLEVWSAIESLVEEGGVRQAGISNCYSLAEFQDLYAAARIKPAVLQNRFHADSGFDRELRAYCRQQKVTYQSFWTLTANPSVLSSATIESLALIHRRTPAQILFRYLTQGRVVPLTGTRSEAHMREDLAIFEFTLSDRECESIDKLLAG